MIGREEQPPQANNYIDDIEESDWREYHPVTHVVTSSEIFAVTGKCVCLSMCYTNIVRLCEGSTVVVMC